MALANYMGSAPGFMSYQRQRRTDGINIPQRAKPAKKAPPYREFDEKVEGNPGDKQFLHDQIQGFNSGLKGLYDQYGGEMDWVVADPKYRQLVGQNSMFVKDQQSAIQNRENTKKRTVEFETMGSGQSANDIELVFENGAYIPKAMTPEGKIKTKGTFLQEVVWNPQEVQHEDGSTGIGYTEFDRGTGTANDFEGYMHKVFTGLGEDAQASFISEGGSQTDNVNLNFAVSTLTERGYKHGDNYDQVAAAADYLSNYGFDENQKYYLYQQMYSDYNNGRAINMPKLDEEGQIVRNKQGKPVFEDRILSADDVRNPNMMKFVNRFYTIDRIQDFADKYRKRTDESSKKDIADFENFDPKTGKPIEDPKLRRHEALVMGVGAVGPGFSRVETSFIPKDGGGVKEVSSDDIQGKENSAIFRDDTNSPEGMSQARAALNGKTLTKVAPSGKVMIGGLWQTVPGIGESQISDILGYRQVPSEDGKSMRWVAQAVIAYDEDDGRLENFNYYNAETGEIESVYDSWEYARGGAKDLQITGRVLRGDAENKNWIINGDYDEGLFDFDSDEKPWIKVDIDVTDQILTWDQKEVGETRKTGGENIEVGADVTSFTKGYQRQQSGWSGSKEDAKF